MNQLSQAAENRALQAPQPEPLISEKDAARRLGISPDLLIQRRFRGQPLIPVIRIGRAVRYAPEDIRAFIAANRHGAQAA